MRWVLLALSVALLTAPVLARASEPVSMVMELDAPLNPGEFAWDESGTDAAAARWVVVDIAAQMLYVYQGGVEIGRSTLVYGSDEKPTPMGTFPVLAKVANKHSIKYDAPMPWSLQLTRSWVAIHSSDVDPRYATHGCIGVPDEFAQTLFNKMRVGDRVTVTRNWMRQVYAAQEHGAELPPPPSDETLTIDGTDLASLTR
ncbi:L,D-transpeptidase [Sphingomonas sp. BGYR3]|uniref:L,D-transpeptidase n=1 Tax=Sphingomonas sp. BGYR3 TaxID=2975483 RepID=UPI0021A3A555|nr:L,D-transpeptidase [Sphingomonas sp. BGYR3]